MGILLFTGGKARRVELIRWDFFVCYLDFEHKTILLIVKEEEKMYRAIDLFAGIGGIRLGFEQAFKGDIKTVFVSEWNEKAIETYRANFDDGLDVTGDITEVDAQDISAHDILLAGFPCQAFSLAGQNVALKMHAGHCFLM